ncbi:MAG TPA: HAMP domain-containing sensor histidine kinase [Mycobacteriales bacterium]|nr:HAMP domain-containing sensor histidine kinase [Mycobacteriales bacterium]
MPSPPLWSARLVQRVVLGLGAVLMATALGLSIIGTTSGVVGSFTMLSNIGSLLLLAAGASRLWVWRLTGRVERGLSGAGLLLLGLLPAVNGISAILFTQPTLRLLGPGSRLALGVPALLLLLFAPRRRPVDTRTRPLRAAAFAGAAATSALTCLTLLRTAGVAWDSPTGWSSAFVVLALGWAAVAVRYARTPGYGGFRGPLARGFSGMAIAQLLFGIALVGRHQAVLLGAAAYVIAAAALYLVGLDEANDIWRASGHRSLQVAADLHETRTVLASEQATREELLHDARSTLAAIRVASGTLHRHRDRIDADMRVDLQDAVRAELTRLERLLDPAHARDLTAFNVREVVEPVLATLRESGLVIQAAVPGNAWARGRGADTATALHNILSNAARYAGSPVDLTVEVGEHDVQLTVADRGPGVPASEREAIFRRGFRGHSSSGADGSGLGLFIAHRLMADQDGSLAVSPRDGGGACFHLTLPALRASRVARV